MMCVQRLAQSLPSFCTIKRHLWLYNQKFLKQYFFPMLVQKHGTLDPKIQISINFALSLPTFCTMITISMGYIQKVRLFDLNLISLLWCNQMLVNLSQKSESYIFFIHSVCQKIFFSYLTHNILRRSHFLLDLFLSFNVDFQFLTDKEF